jgi:hypothetical protein
VDHGTGAIIDPGWQPGFQRAVWACRGISRRKSCLSDCLACRPGHHRLAGPLDDQHPRQLVISRIWERFAPHFTKVGKTENRVIAVPEGGRLPLGRSDAVLLPAHFLHAEGNFHFYDPISKILFTGDLGASMTTGAEARSPSPTWPASARMEGFHRRYMVSNKICACGPPWRASWTWT